MFFDLPGEKPLEHTVGEKKDATLLTCDSNSVGIKPMTMCSSQRGSTLAV